MDERVCEDGCDAKLVTVTPKSSKGVLSASGQRPGSPPGVVRQKLGSREWYTYRT